MNQNPIVVTRTPSANSALLAYAKLVELAFTGNPHLPNPPVTLAQFGQDIASFDASLTKGTGPVRHANRIKIISDLKRYRDYTQSAVDTQTTASDALAIINGAAMFARKTGTRSKPVLAAKNTGLAGLVALIAQAMGPRASYYWQFSLDSKNWSSVPETMKAKTTIGGLTPLTMYYFRMRTLTPKGGLSDFGAAVSLLVL